jgi:hypothetical protein
MISLGRTDIRRAYFRSRRLRLPLNWLRYTGTQANDLFIVSYPRSGTTWLRFLLFELLTGEGSEFVSVNARIPYIGKHRGAPHLLPHGGRVIQSHETFLRGVGSAIYVVRDPRSVVLSEYRWQLRTGLSRESFESFFAKFLAGKANPYGRWDRHVNAWVRSDLASQGRLHAVRFEDLRTDAAGELGRILGFLGMDVDSSLIDEVVANNDLAEMRAKEERAPTWALGALARPDIPFVNAGSTSMWKEELSPSQVQRLGDAFRGTLTSLEYDVFPSNPAVKRGSARVVVTTAAGTGRSKDGPLKVIYIAGWGRSGSTLLDNLLGQIDGFFSTGELRYIWERGVLGEWSCGCGRPVNECEVWSIVLAKVQAGERTPDARAIVEWQKRVTRLRHTWTLLQLGSHNLSEASMLEPYVSLIGKLYAALGEVTGARVVVDSSKRPSDAAILDLVPGVELYVVHLVRDPRAVAFSWGKRQPGIDQHGVLESTASWVAWNLASGALRRKISDRSMLVRYEDFVARPVETLEQIVALVGEDPKGLPSMRNGVFELQGNHTVSGNPGRFRTGSVQVRIDNQWIDRLGAARKAAATLVALPLLRRYQYPLWTPTASTPP